MHEPHDDWIGTSTDFDIVGRAALGEPTTLQKLLHIVDQQEDQRIVMTTQNGPKEKRPIRGIQRPRLDATRRYLRFLKGSQGLPDLCATHTESKLQQRTRTQGSQALKSWSAADENEYEVTSTGFRKARASSIGKIMDMVTSRHVSVDTSPGAAHNHAKCTPERCRGTWPIHPTELQDRLNQSCQNETSKAMANCAYVCARVR